MSDIVIDVKPKIINKDKYKRYLELFKDEMYLVAAGLPKLVISLLKAAFYLLVVLGCLLRVWGESAKKAQQGRKGE